MATIYIKKNNINQIVFTLNELATNLENYFILEIINKANYNKQYLLINLNSDISDNKSRVNKFIITEVEKEDENLFDWQINLSNPEYTYRVYEFNFNPFVFTEAGIDVVTNGIHIDAGSDVVLDLNSDIEANYIEAGFDEILDLDFDEIFSNEIENGRIRIEGIPIGPVIFRGLNKRVIYQG